MTRQSKVNAINVFDLEHRARRARAEWIASLFSSRKARASL
jgi:hypothetical protein